MFLRASIFLCTLILFIPIPLSARRPLETEDSTVMGRGHFDLELGTQMRESASGVTSWRQEVNLVSGLLDPLDIIFSIPFFYSQDLAAGGKVAGLGDLSIRGKWMVLREAAFDEHRGEKGHPALGMYGFMKFPSGNDTEGLGTGTLDGGFGMVLAQSAAALILELNFGYTLYDGQRNRFLYAAALRAPFSQVELVTELVGESDFSSANVDRMDLRVGLAYLVRPAFTFDVAGIFGLTTASPDYGITFGGTFHF